MIYLYTRSGQSVAALDVPSMPNDLIPNVVLYQGGCFVQKYPGALAFVETFCIMAPR